MRPTPRPWPGAALAALVALATLAGLAAAPRSSGMSTGSSVDRGAPAVPLAAVLSGLPADPTAEPDSDGPAPVPGSPRRVGAGWLVAVGDPGPVGPPVSGLTALLRRGFLAGPTRAPPVPSS